MLGGTSLHERKRKRVLGLQRKRDTKLAASLTQLMSALQNVPYSQPVQVMMLVGPCAARPVEVLQLNLPAICAQQPARSMSDLTPADTSKSARAVPHAFMLQESCRAKVTRHMIQASQQLSDTKASRSSKLCIAVRTAEQIHSDNFEFSPHLDISSRKASWCTVDVHTGSQDASADVASSNDVEHSSMCAHAEHANAQAPMQVHNHDQDWYISHAKVRGLHA